MNSFNDFMEQEAFGGNLQSEGHFTLKEGEALKKLSEMALKDVDEWVLKMVQAAVAHSCAELSFRIGRRVIQVDFFGEPLDIAELRDGLTNTKISVSPFWEEAFVGLRTLLFKSEFRVRDSTGNLVAWDGARIHSSSRKPTPGPALSIIVSLNQAGRPILGVCSMHKLLCDRAAFAALRLVLDGREIKVEERFAGRGRFGTWTSPLLFAHYPAGCLETELPHLKRAKAKPLSDPLRNSDFLLSLGRERALETDSCHLSLEFSYRAPTPGDHSRPIVGEVFLVVLTRLGVVCSTRQFRSAIGGALQIPHNEGRTDLSGLKLAETVSLPVNEISQLLTRVREEVRGHHSVLHYYKADSSTVKLMLGYTGLLTAGVLCLAKLGPLAILKWGTGAGFLSSLPVTCVAIDNAEHREEILGALGDLKDRLTRPPLADPT